MNNEDQGTRVEPLKAGADGQDLARSGNEAVVTAATRTEQKLGRAMWAAIDVVKAHIGGFQNWPEELKEAFSEALIADDQTLTAEEIAIGQAIAARRDIP